MEMANVFNRKLFKRKSETAARDKLRSMGGIMASSEPLIREAMKTVQNAPKPQIDIQGIMQAQKRMGAMPAAPLPQVAPSMAQMQPQPQMQPQMQPQPQMQAPPQPAPPQGMNPMQMPVKKLKNGGPPLGGLFGNPDTKARLAANTATPEERARTNILGIDVSRQAGSVIQQPEVNMDDITPERAIQLTAAAKSGKFPVNLRPFTAETAGSAANAKLLNDQTEQLAAAMTDENLSTDDRARNLLSTLGGDAATSNIKKELAKTSEQVFGKRINSDAKIDAMNDAITGFAIAAGRSPRASKNVADGMLVGLAAMKQTEEGRVATQDALAIAAARGTGSGANGVAAETRRDIIRNITTNPTNYGINAYDMTPEAFGKSVNAVANAILGGQTATGSTPTQPMTDVVTVDTQEDYDALAPGTPYIDSKTGDRSTKGS